MKVDTFKKYINEDDMALGGMPPAADPMGGSGLGGMPPMDGQGGKKLEDVPGDPKEKAIAAVSASVDNMKKQLLGIKELETMFDKISKYCDDFKNALKSKLKDGMSPANKPWSDENE